MLDAGRLGRELGCKERELTPGGERDVGALQ